MVVSALGDRRTEYRYGEGDTGAEDHNTHVTPIPETPGGDVESYTDQSGQTGPDILYNDYHNQSSTWDNPPDDMSAAEIATGRALEAELGIPMRPYDNHDDLDFVDINGTTYDAMGQPNAYSLGWTNGGQDFMGSIDKHLNKVADHVVIDLTGSSPAQQQQILDHLQRRAQESQRMREIVDRVKFIGGD